MTQSLSFLYKTLPYVRWLGLSVLAILLFQNIHWQGIPEGDTESYVDIAQKWFQSTYLHFRPVGYPLLIKMSLILTNSFYPLIVLQGLSYLASYIIFSWLIIPHFFQKTIPALLAAIVTLIAFMAPQSVAEISVLLPESICLLPLTIMLLLLIHPGKYTAVGITLTGISLILLKPVWIIIIPALVLLLIFFTIQKKPRERNITGWSLMSIILLFGLNQLVSRIFDPKGEVVASTLNVTINLSMIRYGLVDGAENTRLHQFLTDQNMTSHIRNRVWNDNPEELKDFTSIKNQIPWYQREDQAYWKNILRNNDHALHFLMFQLKRVPYFFSTSASNRSVQLTSSSMINYCYQGLFIRIHKLLIPFLFAAMLILSIFPPISKQLESPVLFAIAIVFAFALVTTFISFQNSLFLRFRSGIEPVVLLCPLLFFYQIRKPAYTYFKNLHRGITNRN